MDTRRKLCPFCNAVPLAVNRQARRRSRGGGVLVHEDRCPFTPEVDRWYGRKREAGR